MIFSMHIEARPNPALLEKVLQTTRVRGFHLRSLDVHSEHNGQQLRIHMTVESEREQARLVAQLSKINGITEINALHAVDPISAPTKTACKQAAVM